MLRDLKVKSIPINVLNPISGTPLEGTASLSDDEISLKMALMLYQGRAIIDRKSLIEPEKLEAMAEKYGAVLY